LDRAVPVTAKARSFPDRMKSMSNSTVPMTPSILAAKRHQ
jgi:hypothetical protein